MYKLMYFCIFGSHPELSKAELSAVLPDIQHNKHFEKMSVFESKQCNPAHLMKILGGTIKLGEVIKTLPIQKLTPQAIANLLTPESNTNSRSLDFGLTVYGSKTLQKKLSKFPIQLKKELKARGFSVRWVTGKSNEPLSPAAVAKCKLTQKPNADLCLTADGDTLLIGKTSHVQDADAWSKRDYDRPHRDSKNGMLPPKLARMMVNLSQTPEEGVLLDPFCGSGTILMEAALATDAKKIIGSDIDGKQINDTQKNNDWLLREKIISPHILKKIRTFKSDVRDLKKFLHAKTLDTVATEGYLGPPLQGNETQKQLEVNAREVQKLWFDSLKALKPLLKPTATLVIITPGYQTKRGSAVVDLTTNLDVLGYKIANPKIQNSNNSLVYGRENQFVKRKIQILKLL